MMFPETDKYQQFNSAQGHILIRRSFFLAKDFYMVFSLFNKQAATPIVSRDSEGQRGAREIA